MAEARLSIFIRHPGKAQGYAMRAKAAFESRGYDTWVWGHDRPARGDLDTELYNTIERCKYFAHICTRETRRSPGQRDERLFAKLLEKKPFFLLVFKPRFFGMFRRDFIPTDLDHRAIYNEVFAESFDQDCIVAAERLLREQTVDHEPANISEGIPIDVTVEATAQTGITTNAVVEKGAPVEPS